MHGQREVFRKLHEQGCFVMPNPWDTGTTRFLTSAGFAALATTSAGLAFSLAKPDSPAALDRDVVLAHIQSIVDATTLPVNADFQSGYGATPAGVADSVRRCVATGVAGLSIEDATGDPDDPLYDIPTAVARLAAARDAIGDSGVVLTGRAEGFIAGRPDIDDVMARLQAFSAAGADCLYAPGLRGSGEVAAVVAAVHPKPVNVLATPSMTVSGLAALGARRISVGSGLARVAWGAFMAAARELADAGTFTGLGGAAPFAELNGLFE